MKAIHVPAVNARYWAGITLASVFGTNMGDFYAHESGLGLGVGLLVLAALVAVTVVLERADSRVHELWYWLAIIIIRTGATNIADFLSFGVHINMLVSSGALALLIALLAGVESRWGHQSAPGFPQTNTRFWVAMLAAGVLGTVMGDFTSHALGTGIASLLLCALLAVELGYGRLGYRPPMFLHYWLTVAIARTAGTAVGDHLAESHDLNVGLPTSTLITGCAFVAVLLLWRGGGQRPVSA
jgi:uncharacterized membrane-anchored protein